MSQLLIYVCNCLLIEQRLCRYRIAKFECPNVVLVRPRTGEKIIQRTQVYQRGVENCVINSTEYDSDIWVFQLPRVLVLQQIPSKENASLIKGLEDRFNPQNELFTRPFRFGALGFILHTPELVLCVALGQRKTTPYVHTTAHGDSPAASQRPNRARRKASKGGQAQRNASMPPSKQPLATGEAFTGFEGETAPLGARLPALDPAQLFEPVSRTGSSGAGRRGARAARRAAGPLVLVPYLGKI
jgi:hypothetical protein